MRYASKAVIVDVLADLGPIFDTEPLASVEIRRRRAARMLIGRTGSRMDALVRIPTDCRCGLAEPPAHARDGRGGAAFLVREGFAGVVARQRLGRRCCPSATGAGCDACPDGYR